VHCHTNADCCGDGPSSLCQDGACEANEFCAQDPNCFGSRFGACGAPPIRCGDGVCAAGEVTTCPADCPTRDACASLVARHWAGAQGCYPIGGYAQFTADELDTVWNTTPQLICAYAASDGRVGPCGPLIANNALYCPLDNTISWDIAFMNAQYAGFGDFAPAVVIAHEWGHRNQALAGLIGGSRTTFQNEQHADCQAGIFAAVAEDRGLLQMGDVMEAFASLCAGGGTSGWFDPTSHGSCGERVAAFQHGYDTAKNELVRVCSTKAVQTMLDICRN
jgi:hypothetical protein